MRGEHDLGEPLEVRELGEEGWAVHESEQSKAAGTARKICLCGVFKLEVARRLACLQKHL